MMSEFKGVETIKDLPTGDNRDFDLRVGDLWWNTKAPWLKARIVKVEYGIVFFRYNHRGFVWQLGIAEFRNRMRRP